VQAYDSRVLDAAALRLPLMGFLPAGDPRMHATVAEIRRHLMPEGMVQRWQGGEAFTACSFWLVEVLALQGRTGEAEALYSHALSFANDLGLFAEEVDPRTHTQWGNFPHSTTHLGVIAAAQGLLGISRATAHPIASAPAIPIETPPHR